MKTLHDRVEKRLRSTICPACIYRLANGGCGLTGRDECPILVNIDAIIRIVRTTHSDSIGPYVDRLREAVCANCTMQDIHGHCRMRDHADCALDDYFALIVEIVEEELEHKSN